MLRMIDDFSVRCHQIYIFTGSICVCLLKKLLNTAVIHINQKNALHGTAISGELYRTAQRHHPVISVRWIIKEILHMGCGEMKIFQFSGCILKPFLRFYINSWFLCGNGRCFCQLPVICITCHTDQLILVRLVQKIHRILQTLTSDVCILDYRIIHCIRNTAHIPQIILQIDGRLIKKLP